ncbi:hypothetical protein FB192DRAFT_1366124 [Mucor lusitanicus]|uniref:NADPH-dependent diflavin oxidoreductase 1 n=2 Tax=Mucor circinelloides f. lusitanicus TaxID=29924 RepID=A0A168QEH2_MUCCL|nr:hypothetical protein FB192DRAFT_1366124 [Mucor lusitanicus]OAD09126.1 hypothetical protein MUCCIDRAFT_136898 [Mucor lusitanicus CBS 277.49]
MDRSLLILFGSETGCAQDVAENLARQARRRHFKTRVVAMDDYDKSQLVEEKLVFFVCSTTGQGIEPANMKKFWKFLLRKNLPNDILSDLDCAVLGLGDSSYRKFNYPSKKLYKRLLQLGANMIVDRGDCDDQHYLGLDGAFVPWAKNLWDVVLEKYPASEPLIPDDVLLPPSFRMEFITDGQAQPQTTLAEEFNLVVRKNERITAADHFQDVRHIELACTDQDFKYEPGDIAVITPQNLVQDVDLFFEQLGWTEHADKLIRFTPFDEFHTLPAHWPSVMTFRDLFVYFLDVFGVPRRSFFEMLAYFTTDENHTERLREFASPQGQEDMWAYCARPRRHIGEVLFDFKPFDIPFDYMLDLFPQLQPRSFSIASSLNVHPKSMELCVAVVKYKTKMRKIRRGVFTKWMSTWEEGDVIPRVRIAKGTMTLPPSQDIPLIAIGPGTGVAPMRSFLEERIVEQGATQNVLLFGCRYHDKDFYFADQWKEYEQNGQLVLLTAFSRDQDSKVYVQDKIRQHSELLWDLIENQQAKVVLSGSLDKMPGEVAYAFKQIFMKEGGLDAAEAEGYFSDMIKSGQYQEECWN